MITDKHAEFELQYIVDETNGKKYPNIAILCSSPDEMLDVAKSLDLDDQYIDPECTPMRMVATGRHEHGGNYMFQFKNDIEDPNFIKKYNTAFVTYEVFDFNREEILSFLPILDIYQIFGMEVKDDT